MSRNITLNELQAPFKVTKVRVDGIVKYDIDNAYPTRMERVIDGSVTAKSSALMLTRFLIGEGFENPELNSIVIGKDRFGRDINLYHLLGKVCRSVAYYSGFYLRLGYNGELKIGELRDENFKHCRFVDMDTQNHTGMIAVYNNWDKQTGRHEPSKANKVHVYNTTKEAIESQIKSVKGFKKWKGQIFFWFDDDDYIYPVSLVDPVIYDADTEKQISLFKNGELRRGFFLKYIIHHTSFTNPKDAEDFKEKLGKVMGGGHEYSSLVMDGEFDADGNLKDGPNIKITKIDQNVSDKLFDTYEKSTTNNIRKAFHAIPQILIDYEDSKLGTTSGEALRQAAEFYNSQTEDTRKNIGQCFQQIMKNWKDDMTNETFNIKPLSLGTTVEL
jgi:hypothetical protein